MTGYQQGQYDGSALKARRVQLGLTTRQLAKASGLDVSTIGRVERGDQPVRREVVTRVEQALDRLEAE